MFNVLSPVNIETRDEKYFFESGGDRVKYLNYRFIHLISILQLRRRTGRSCYSTDWFLRIHYIIYNKYSFITLVNKALDKNVISVPKRL